MEETKKFKIDYRGASLKILPLLVFAAIAILNAIPEGYIVSGTDHAFFLDIENNAKTFFYTWTNGLAYGPGIDYNLQAAIPYYTLWRFLHVIGLSDSGLQSALFFLFLVSAYYSFYFSFKKILPHGPKQTIWLGLFSFAYAINGYTLNLFMHVFGYFYQQIFYLFAPLMLSYTYAFFRDKKTGAGNFFWLILFASMGFNNPGFFAAWLVAAGILFLAAMPKRAVPVRTLIFRFIALSILALLANAYWLFPYFASLSDKAADLTNGNVIWNMADWIRWQSSRLIDLVRFFPLSSADKFPYNWTAAGWIKNIFIAWSFVYIFFGAAAYARAGQSENIRRAKNAFALLFFIFLIFSAKTAGPLSGWAAKIFSWPLINSLRSVDKFGIMIPFVLIGIIYLGLIYDRRSYRLKAFVLSVILVYPAAFYGTGIQTNLSAAFERGENYLNAKYSYLVKVPEDYRAIAEITNTKHDPAKSGKIQYLPFGVINSPGWQQYPKWRFVGNDVTASLFRAPVQVPAFYLNRQAWNYAAQFSASGDPFWFAQMFALMNDEYLVVNRDVAENFWNAAAGKITELENGNILHKLYSGKTADLYEVDEKIRLPQIYSPARIIYSDIDYKDAARLLAVKKDGFDNLYFFGKIARPDFLNQVSFASGKTGLPLETVHLFDYQKIGVRQEMPGRLYSDALPVVYELKRRDAELELIPSGKDSDYVRMNGQSDYADAYLKSRKFTVPEDGILVNGSYFPGDILDKLEFNAKNPALKIAGDFRAVSKNLLADGSFENNTIANANNCGNGDTEKPLQISASAGTEAYAGKRSLKLWSKNGRACTLLNQPVPDFSPKKYYRLSFAYKNTKGNIVQAAVWQSGADVRAPFIAQRTEKSEWRQVSAVFQPLPNSNGLILFFYAYSDGKGAEAETLFDDVSLIEVEPDWIKEELFYSPQTKAEYEHVNSGLILESAEGQAKNDMFENDFDGEVGAPNLCGQKNKNLSPNISAQTAVDAENGRKRYLELSSENGLACKIEPIADFQPNHLYRLEFFHRYVSGQPGSAALWQAGAEVSYPRFSLATSTAWKSYSAVFKPEAGVKSAGMYFYSDSQGKEKTVNHYDSLKLFDLGLVPENLYSTQEERLDLGKPEKISYRRISPVAYAVLAEGVQNDFLLAFSESYNSKWRLLRLPDGADWQNITLKNIMSARLADRGMDRHFLANGYANGWLVEAGETEKPQEVYLIYYWPQILFYAGSAITLISALIIGMYALYARKKTVV